MSTTNSFSTREAWKAAVKDNPLTIETFDAERPRTLIYNDINTAGVLKLETVRPIGATGGMAIIGDTNSQNINGAASLYLGLDGNPKASLGLALKLMKQKAVSRVSPNFQSSSNKKTLRDAMKNNLLDREEKFSI